MTRDSPAIRRKQASAAKFGSSFAPETWFGLSLRNLVTRLFRLPFLVDFLFARELRDDIRFPHYGY